MKRILITIIVLILLLLAYFKFSEKDTIKIGLIGGLSGKYSELGHSLLNGVNLALDEVNFEIDGKKIEIISKDDRQKSTFAKLAVEEFKREKIDLIIGSGTSSMTKVVLESMDEGYKPILFSPSASSNFFSKKDDNFLRTQVSQSVDSFHELTRYLVSNNKKSIYAIYDSRNAAYSESYAYNFERSLIENGGNPLVQLREISKDFSFIVDDIKKLKKVDAVVIVANPIDTAKLSQFLRINDINQTIVGSSWSKSSKLLEDGGRYIEGMIFLTSYDNSSTNKNYLDFIKKYEAKYKITPSIYASQSYETGKIIIEALKKNSDLKEFKQTILEIETFKGLQGDIKFDKYGDVKREHLLMIVKNNKYIVIKNWNFE